MPDLPDLSINFCGVKSPNPFWLASAPPTNTGDQIMRAFDHGWGGAVWKTLGKPIQNVSSRFGAVGYKGQAMMGFNNIELITDRPLSVNFKEISEVKKRYAQQTLIVSLMVESKEEWKELIRRSEDAGADLLELNFGCPHGMCERGMGSAVGSEPQVLAEITSWAVNFARVPVIVKLTPNITDIVEPALAAIHGGAQAISLINTIKSLIGIDLNNLVPLPRVGNFSTNGGYCGPAVKPIALHMLASLSRHPKINSAVFSGMGGISNWHDAAEFIALGATSVQVCTAVMHHGYRIVEDMKEGLSLYLKSHGYSSLQQLRGRAVEYFKEWRDLDLNYRVTAHINEASCIGCNKCYVACRDGAHQCIYLPGMTREKSIESGHPDAPALNIFEKHENSRVPWVDEKECVGCNLCQLVCPVEGCITMLEKS
jgi:dihydropyrimidine dehydrogenase (NAD+) subunit PreA